MYVMRSVSPALFILAGLLFLVRRFDLTTGICAAGKVCRDWQQIVWVNTTVVGCGVVSNIHGKYERRKSSIILR